METFSRKWIMKACMHLRANCVQIAADTLFTVNWRGRGFRTKTDLEKFRMKGNENTHEKLAQHINTTVYTCNYQN